MARLVAVQKLERAVVDGQAQDAHVVSIHHAVAKAHGLPVRHHLGGALGHRCQQGHIGVATPARIDAAGRVQAVNHVIGQDFELGMPVAVTEMLEMAKADKAGCQARHHGRSLKGLAPHGRVRAGHAQGAGGGYVQSVHGLAAQKLTDAAAQHRPAIAHARERRQADPLELPLQAVGFAQQNGAPVTQLTGPDTKLVAAVDRGQGQAAGQRRIATERLQPGIGLPPVGGQAQLLPERGTVANPVGRWQRRGPQRHIKAIAQSGKTVLPGQQRPGVGGEGGRHGLIVTEAAISGEIWGHAASTMCLCVCTCADPKYRTRTSKFRRQNHAWIDAESAASYFHPD